MEARRRVFGAAWFGTDPAGCCSEPSSGLHASFALITVACRLWDCSHEHLAFDTAADRPNQQVRCSPGGSLLALAAAASRVRLLLFGLCGSGLGGAAPAAICNFAGAAVGAEPVALGHAPATHAHAWVVHFSLNQCPASQHCLLKPCFRWLHTTMNRPSCLQEGVT